MFQKGVMIISGLTNQDRSLPIATDFLFPHPSTHPPPPPTHHHHPPIVALQQFSLGTEEVPCKWKHFQRHWPFVRGFTGHRWTPHTQARDSELLWYFLWSASETVEQTIETPVILVAIVLVTVMDMGSITRSFLLRTKPLLKFEHKIVSRPHCFTKV